MSADYSELRLADFGSAFSASDPADGVPTPYLVSRFYRPPEVVLATTGGRGGDDRSAALRGADLWSAAVAAAELFTGAVLFPGRDNNDMTRLFVETLGPPSRRMLRRHARAYEEDLRTPPFFDPNDDWAFRRATVDRVTNRPVVEIVRTTRPAPGRQLSTMMLRSCGAKEDRTEVLRFADLLTKCLALDPGRRTSVEEAYRHDFFTTTTTTGGRRSRPPPSEEKGQQ